MPHENEEHAEREKFLQQLELEQPCQHAVPGAVSGDVHTGMFKNEILVNIQVLKKAFGINPLLRERWVPLRYFP